MFKKILLIGLISSYVFSDTLPMLIEKSQKNKLIQSSYTSIDATKLDYESLSRSYMPSLTLGGGYMNSSHESASTANNGVNASLKIRYNLYDGNKKENSFNALKSKVKSQNLSLENQKNRIALEVINQYFTYLSLFEQKKAKEKEIEQLDIQYKNKKNFFNAGTLAIDEVEKISYRLENANVLLQELELNMQTILHFLEYTTGEKVSINSGSKIKTIANKDTSLRSDIKALEYDLASIKSNAKAKKSAIYPQVNLDNTYSYSDSNFNNKNFDINPDSQNVLALNLSWKLFDFDSSKKEYEANMKRYLALKSQYEYEKNKLNVDLKLAYKAYEISKIKIKSTQAGLKSANSTYKAIKAKYDNFLVNNVTFLEALSEKYEAIGFLESAKYDLEIKKANIIYYSGKDLVDFID